MDIHAGTLREATLVMVKSRASGFEEAPKVEEYGLSD